MRKPNPTKLAAALVIALGSASVFANTGKTTSTDTSTNLSNNAATSTTLSGTATDSSSSMTPGPGTSANSSDKGAAASATGSSDSDDQPAKATKSKKSKTKTAGKSAGAPYGNANGYHAKRDDATNVTPKNEDDKDADRLGNVSSATQPPAQNGNAGNTGSGNFSSTPKSAGGR